jgi:hypothetical protein
MIGYTVFRGISRQTARLRTTDTKLEEQNNVVNAIITALIFFIHVLLMN